MAIVEATSPERASDVRVVRVGGGSDVTKVAKTIIIFLQDPDVRIVELCSIGAGATNQAIKAVAIARSYDKDLDIICRPAMATTTDIRPPTNGASHLTLVIQELQVL